MPDAELTLSAWTNVPRGAPWSGLRCHDRRGRDPGLVFADRAEAGRRLAAELIHLKGEAPVLLALPRGGVPVAFEIAAQLAAPLGLVLVRKIGAPYNPEFAVGAVAGAADPVVVLHDSALKMLDLSREELRPAIDRACEALRERRETYGAAAIQDDLRDKTVILVDDGIATGATMEAAVAWARRQRPRRLVVAVPIGSPASLAKLAEQADEVVCADRNDWYSAVSSAYLDFAQVDDETVRAMLRRAADRRSVGSGDGGTNA